MGKIVSRNEMPLQLQVLVEPFGKWDLDFVGPIDLPFQEKRYILACTDYVTKWVEAKPFLEQLNNQ